MTAEKKVRFESLAEVSVNVKYPFNGYLYDADNNAFLSDQNWSSAF